MSFRIPSLAPVVKQAAQQFANKAQPVARQAVAVGRQLSQSLPSGNLFAQRSLTQVVRASIRPLSTTASAAQQSTVLPQASREAALNLQSTFGNDLFKRYQSLPETIQAKILNGMEAKQLKAHDVADIVKNQEFLEQPWRAKQPIIADAFELWELGSDFFAPRCDASRRQATQLRSEFEALTPNGPDHLWFPGVTNPLDSVNLAMAGHDRAYHGGYAEAAQGMDALGRHADLGIKSRTLAADNIAKHNKVIEQSHLYLRGLLKEGKITENHARELIRFIDGESDTFLACYYSTLASLEAGIGMKQQENLDPSKKVCGHRPMKTALAFFVHEISLRMIRLAGDVSRVPVLINSRSDSAGATLVTRGDSRDEDNLFIGIARSKFNSVIRDTLPTKDLNQIWKRLEEINLFETKEFPKEDSVEREFAAHIPGDGLKAFFETLHGTNSAEEKAAFKLQLLEKYNDGLPANEQLSLKEFNAVLTPFAFAEPICRTWTVDVTRGDGSTFKAEIVGDAFARAGWRACAQNVVNAMRTGVVDTAWLELKNGDLETYEKIVQYVRQEFPDFIGTSNNSGSFNWGAYATTEKTSDADFLSFIPESMIQNYEQDSKFRDELKGHFLKLSQALWFGKNETAAIEAFQKNYSLSKEETAEVVTGMAQTLHKQITNYRQRLAEVGVGIQLDTYNHMNFINAALRQFYSETIGEHGQLPQALAQRWLELTGHPGLESQGAIGSDYGDRVKEIASRLGIDDRAGSGTHTQFDTRSENKGGTESTNPILDNASKVLGLAITPK